MLCALASQAYLRFFCFDGEEKIWYHPIALSRTTHRPGPDTKTPMASSLTPKDCNVDIGETLIAVRILIRFHNAQLLILYAGTLAGVSETFKAPESKDVLSSDNRKRKVEALYLEDGVTKLHDLAQISGCS